MGAAREQALAFGARNSLVGILTSPAPPAPGADGPTVVILNAGIVHRVGANRMHVELARALAADGVASLRFDLSGLGDSDKRDDALPPTEAALADVAEALDHLEAAGRTRGAVLLGLCSGANLALLSAAADRRVVGLVLLDPFIPRTTGFYLRWCGMQAFRRENWLNLASGRYHLWRSLGQRLSRIPRRSETEGARLSKREIHDILEKAFQAALQRGLPLLAVFTSGLPAQHNYREQLLDAFPRLRFGEGLRLEYFAQSDHTFTAWSHREALIRLVREWTRSTVLAPPPPGRSQP